MIAQVAVMALVFFGPRRLAGWPTSLLPGPRLCKVVGAMLMVLGALLLLAALARLGRGASPLPRPPDDAVLVQSGPYALVRHPIYAGGALFAFGWALFVCGPLTLGYAALLLALLDLKSRREERWLRQRFPGYVHYQRRVRRLIPFLY